MNKNGPMSACCKGYKAILWPRGRGQSWRCTCCGNFCDLQPPAESGSKKYCDHGQKEQDCPYCHIRLLESKLRLALDALDDIHATATVESKSHPATFWYARKAGKTLAEIQLLTPKV